MRLEIVAGQWARWNWIVGPAKVGRRQLAKYGRVEVTPECYLSARWEVVWQSAENRPE